MPTLETLTAEANLLSLDEQLALLELLARRIRERTHQPVSLDDDLAAMAVDPDIQRELRQIEAEFAETESDGLNGTRS